MLKMFYEEDRRSKRTKNDDDDDGEKPPGALDLFDDPSMEEFFSKGVRGGQSFIATREANGNIDPNSKGNHLLYVDGKKGKLLRAPYKKNYTVHFFFQQPIIYTEVWKPLNYPWETSNG